MSLLSRFARTVSTQLRYRQMARRRGRSFRGFYLLPGGTEKIPRDQLPPVVALTFDDGPFLPVDPAILDRLAVAEATATFFLVGNRVEQHHDIVRQMVSAGHEIASHGWSHRRMSPLTFDEQQREIRYASAALRRLGSPALWFRPPWGDFDENTLRAAELEGQRLLLWDVDSRDYRCGDAGVVAGRVVERMRAASVICMHSNRSVAAEALPRILEGGRAKGLQFVSVSKWLAAIS